MDQLIAKITPSEANGIRKVQVGCGPKNILPDWWNIDIRDFKGIDQVMDVTKKWPWENVLDYVYGEHFLEHLAIPEACSFLVEAGNAIKIGGRIRLTTPSLEWVLKTHFTFDETLKTRELSQTWAINRAFRGWGHQFLYSKEMLLHLLNALCFENIVFFDYGRSDDPNLINLERHGGWRIDHGYPSVWIVEATRGSQLITSNVSFDIESDSMYLKYVKSGH